MRYYRLKTMRNAPFFIVLSPIRRPLKPVFQKIYYYSETGYYNSKSAGAVRLSERRTENDSEPSRRQSVRPNRSKVRRMLSDTDGILLPAKKPSPLIFEGRRFFCKGNMP